MAKKEKASAAPTMLNATFDREAAPVNLGEPAMAVRVPLLAP